MVGGLESTRRTTIRGRGGTRVGDLLNRDFTASTLNQVWVAGFTYARTWSGFVDVAFVVDVYAQRIVGRHAVTSKPLEPVLVPLEMAAWARGQRGHPITRGALTAHSDAGSKDGFNWSSQHLDREGVDGQVSGMNEGVDGQVADEISRGHRRFDGRSSASSGSSSLRA